MCKFNFIPSPPLQFLKTKTTKQIELKKTQ